jgi:hypothetical protein
MYVRLDVLVKFRQTGPGFLLTFQLTFKGSVLFLRISSGWRHSFWNPATTSRRWQPANRSFEPTKRIYLKFATFSSLLPRTAIFFSVLQIEIVKLIPKCHKTYQKATKIIKFIPKFHKTYQKAIKNTKWPQNAKNDPFQGFQKYTKLG